LRNFIRSLLWKKRAPGEIVQSRMNRLRQGGQARISFFSFQDIITSVTGILILVTLMLSFSVTTAETTSAEEQQLNAARARLSETEAENERLQQRRIEAATLPDPAQLQTQIESLQREQSELQKQVQQSETTLASARERRQKQTAQTQAAAALREKINTLEQQLDELREKAARAKSNVNVVYIVPDVETRQNPKTPIAIVVSGDRLRAQRLNGSELQDIQISSADSLDPVLTRHKPDRDFLVFYFRPSGARWFAPFRSMARERGFEVGYDAVEENKQLIFTAP
jgi:hypothetical protein